MTIPRETQYFDLMMISDLRKELLEHAPEAEETEPDVSGHLRELIPTPDKQRRTYFFDEQVKTMCIKA